MAERHLRIVLAAEDVLGEADTRAREPLRSGHRAVSQHLLATLGEADLEELGDRGPEPVQVSDRPLPELVVAVKRQPAVLTQPLRVADQGRTLHPLGRRLPQELGFTITHGRSVRDDPRMADELLAPFSGTVIAIAHGADEAVRAGAAVRHQR